MRSSTKRPRERGAVLVELAIISPLLILLVLMGTETGMVLRDHLTISAASRSGARVGSSSGVARLADHDVLQAVAAGLGSVPTSDVELVIVFEPDAGGQMAPACRTSSQNGLCNRYTGADLARPSSDFTGTTSCTGSSPDRYWCPLLRERDQASVDGPDWFGVYVQIRHRSLAQGFMGDRSLSNTTVMRLEPRFTP